MGWGNNYDEHGVHELKLTQQLKCVLRLGSVLWYIDGTSRSDDGVGRSGNTPLVMVVGV